IRIPDVPGRLDRSLRIERQNGVVAFAARADAGREKEAAIPAEGKSAGERDDCRRKHSFSCCIEGRSKCHDRPRSAHSDVVAAFGSKVAATWVQPRYHASLAHHTPLVVER